MLKHVLVPLDTSALAETALPYAQEIIEENGQITLLLVLDTAKHEILAPSLDFQLDPSVADALEKQNKEMRKHAQDYLDRVTATIENKSLKIETVLQSGNPAEEIANLAKVSGVDAIVMSTHGRTGLSSWLLGSVTQKVIGIATCPVFVIPPQNDADDATTA